MHWLNTYLVEQNIVENLSATSLYLSLTNERNDVRVIKQYV